METAKGASGEPKREPPGNRKGDQWKTIEGASGKPQREPIENRKVDQWKTPDDG